MELDIKETDKNFVFTIVRLNQGPIGVLQSVSTYGLLTFVYQAKPCIMKDAYEATIMQYTVFFIPVLQRLAIGRLVILTSPAIRVVR